MNTKGQGSCCCNDLKRTKKRLPSLYILFCYYIFFIETFTTVEVKRFGKTKGKTETNQNVKKGLCKKGHRLQLITAYQTSAILMRPLCPCFLSLSDISHVFSFFFSCHLNFILVWARVTHLFKSYFKTAHHTMCCK